MPRGEFGACVTRRAYANGTPFGNPTSLDRAAALRTRDRRCHVGRRRLHTALAVASTVATYVATRLTVRAS